MNVGSEERPFSVKWAELLRTLFAHGKDIDSRVGKCKELIGVQLSLAPENVFLRNPRRKLSAAYAWAEFLWYMSRTNKLDMILSYAPQYIKYSDDGGLTSNGAYGHRVRTNASMDQLSVAADILTQHRNSRQCFVGIWSPNLDLEPSLWKKTQDLPCTIGWQFLLRDSELHMVTTMRSNDVWLGTPYDVFAFTRLQIHMAAVVGAKPGMYYHNVGSMHIYEKHWDAAQEAIEVDPEGLPLQDFDRPFGIESLEEAIEVERRVRLGLPYTVADLQGLQPAIHALEEYHDSHRRNRLGRKDDTRS